MKEPILKAVAMPPKIFWAPAVVSLANMSVQFALMMMWVALTGGTPMWFIFSIVLSHIGLISLGAKDPHLSKLLMSWGKSGATATRNVYPERGTKFAP